MASKRAKNRTHSAAIDRHVNELSLQGLSSRQIAETILSKHRLRIGPRAVQKRLEKLNAASEQERQQEIQRELRAMDWTTAEAMFGWRRSQQDAESQTTETVAAEPEGEKPKAETILGAVVKTKKTVEGQSGDPRFLQVIVKCSERRARLRGLDAPSDLRVSGAPGGGVIVYLPEEDEMPAGGNGTTPAERG